MIDRNCDIIEFKKHLMYRYVAHSEYLDLELKK